MTIVFRGHVESLKMGHLNNVELTLYGERATCISECIVVTVTPEMAKMYYPGTPIQVTIHPLVAAPPAKGER